MEFADAASEVQVRIVDTGSGIPAEELPKLFQQFRVIGGVDDRKTGGLGLGLFLAKSFIDAHGGTVKIDSAVGKGTTVAVKLPKKPPARDS